MRRARVAALVVLDPQEEGRIDEEAFLAWWAHQEHQAGAV